MGFAPTEPIEKALAELRAQRDAQIGPFDRAIAELEEMLARMRNGKAKPSTGNGSEGVFRRKYDENARELVTRCLREARKPLHVGQIQDALRAKGYIFLNPTVALSLKQLLQVGKVRKSKAPAGSGFTHAWSLEKDQPIVEESRLDA